MPVDALTRYWKEDGENGPPSGPETAIPVRGVTINEGRGWLTGFVMAATGVSNSIAVAVEHNGPVGLPCGDYHNSDLETVSLNHSAVLPKAPNRE